MLRGEHLWDLRTKFWKTDHTTTQETCNLNITISFPSPLTNQLLKIKELYLCVWVTQKIFAPSMYYYLSCTLLLAPFRLLNICTNCLHSLLLPLMTLTINFLPKETILETSWNISLSWRIKLGTSTKRAAASSNSQVLNRITWVLIWCL